MAKYGPETHEIVGRELHEMKEGKLRSGSGQKVTNPKQAIAIGLSEARREGDKVPPAPEGTASAAKEGTDRKAAAKKRGAAKKSSAKSSGTKKTAAKKSPAKSSGAKKAAAEKSSTKKIAAKR